MYKTCAARLDDYFKSVNEILSAFEERFGGVVKIVSKRVLYGTITLIKITS
jgi:hypothetical protein